MSQKWLAAYSRFIIMSSLQHIYTKAYGLLLSRDGMHDINQTQKLEEQSFQDDYKTHDRGGHVSKLG